MNDFFFTTSESQILLVIIGVTDPNPLFFCGWRWKRRRTENFRLRAESLISWDAHAMPYKLQPFALVTKKEGRYSTWLLPFFGICDMIQSSKEISCSWRKFFSWALDFFRASLPNGHSLWQRLVWLWAILGQPSQGGHHLIPLLADNRTLKTFEGHTLFFWAL